MIQLWAPLQNNYTTCQSPFTSLELWVLKWTHLQDLGEQDRLGVVVGGALRGGRWVCRMQELGGSCFVSATTHHSPRISENLRQGLISWNSPIRLGVYMTLGEVGSSGQCVAWECICGFIWVELLVTNLHQQERICCQLHSKAKVQRPKYLWKKLNAASIFFSFFPNVSAWSSCFSYLWCTICLQLWVFSQQGPGQLMGFMLQLFFFFFWWKRR